MFGGKELDGTGELNYANSLCHFFGHNSATERPFGLKFLDGLLDSLAMLTAYGWPDLLKKSLRRFWFCCS